MWRIHCRGRAVQFWRQRGVRGMRWLAARKRFRIGRKSRPAARERRAVRSEHEIGADEPLTAERQRLARPRCTQRAGQRQRCRFEWRCEARTMANKASTIEDGDAIGRGRVARCRVVRTVALRKWLLAGVSLPGWKREPASDGDGCPLEPRRTVTARRASGGDIPAHGTIMNSDAGSNTRQKSDDCPHKGKFSQNACVPGLWMAITDQCPHTNAITADSSIVPASTP